MNAKNKETGYWKYTYENNINECCVQHNAADRDFI